MCIRDRKQLDNHSLFNRDTFIQGIKEKLQDKISQSILDSLDSVKCFPVFVSKGYLKPGNNIFLVGDAFFAFPPSFAQGASQSIEGGYELFDNITNNKSNFIGPIKPIKDATVNGINGPMAIIGSG